MKVVVKKRRNLVLTAIAALLIAAFCFFVGLYAARMLSGEHAAPARLESGLEEGTELAP